MQFLLIRQARYGDTYSLFSRHVLSPVHVVLISLSLLPHFQTKIVQHWRIDDGALSESDWRRTRVDSITSELGFHLLRCLFGYLNSTRRGVRFGRPRFYRPRDISRKRLGVSNYLAMLQPVLTPRPLQWQWHKNLMIKLQIRYLYSLGCASVQFITA